MNKSNTQKVIGIISGGKKGRLTERIFSGTTVEALPADLRCWQAAVDELNAMNLKTEDQALTEIVSRVIQSLKIPSKEQEPLREFLCEVFSADEEFAAAIRDCLKIKGI